MSHEVNDPHESVLDELESDRLRQAVEQVRSNPVPEDSLNRALDRAQSLTAVKLAVEHQPAIEKRPGRRFYTVVVAASLLLLVPALALLIGQDIRDAREAARRTQNNNNMMQTTLAMHSYNDVFSDTYLPALAPVVLVDSSNSTSSGREVSEVPPKVTLPSSKIIHSADVSLVVDEITTAESRLSELVQQFQGYIGNSQISEPKGRPRSARWVVRIPVESLDAFLREVVELGTPENRSTNSQDVTEEYVDLETRIATKKELEKRILGLLEKHTGDIKDVLAVEEQLARVREEIERMEGRVKHFDNVTAMTTVAISAREERDYVPPQTPSFSTEIGRTWGRSIEVLQGFGKSLVLVIVAAGPWLPFIVVLIFISLRMLKRRRVRHDRVQ